MRLIKNMADLSAVDERYYGSAMAYYILIIL